MDENWGHVEIAQGGRSHRVESASFFFGRRRRLYVTCAGLFLCAGLWLQPLHALLALDARVNDMHLIPRGYGIT